MTANVMGSVCFDLVVLTNWPLDQQADISMTFSTAFSWMQSFDFFFMQLHLKMLGSLYGPYLLEESLFFIMGP